jgi:titin
MGTSPIRGVDALWMPFSPSGVDSGATASGYQYTIDNGVNWQDATYDPAKSGTILFLYGLTSGKAYSVKVRATNAFGIGAASAAKATSTATAPTAAPVLGTVSFVNGTLTIGFTGLTAAKNGGSPITGYQYSTNGGTNWNNMTREQVLANKVILTGLSAASRTIKVRAFNGLYSAASAAKVVSAPLATPAFTVVAGTGKVTLTITALASTSTGNSAVTYQYTKNNGSTWITAAAGATIITASKGTAVSVKVRAINSVGEGAASATAKCATAK